MFICETKGRIHTVTCLSCGYLHAASADPELILKVIEIHKAWHMTQSLERRKKKPQAVLIPPDKIVKSRMIAAA